jgi:PAS domain S-box-containing protein
MSYRNISIATIAGIAGMLIILTAISFNELGQLNKLTESINSLKLTSHIISNLHRVLEAVQAAEAGQRGYLITGREDYLTPFNEAIPEAQQQLIQLRQLTKDNPELSQSISDLDQTIALKFAEQKKTIELRQTKGVGAANQFVATDIGKQTMDKISKLVKQIADNENDLLISRTQEQDRRAQDSFLVLILIFCIAITFQIATGFTTIIFLKKQKLAEQSLKASDERFRLLLSGIKDYAVYMLDPQGNVITWNEGAQKIKGYKADEVIGKHFSIFYTDEEKKNNRPEDELKTAVESGIYESEEERVRKDGSKFWANVIVRPVFNDSKQLTGFVKVTRDISDKKEMDRRVSEFYSTVSHELRTPLTSVRGTLSLMEGGRLGPLPDRVQQLAHTARLESDRLIRLVNDILDIRKIETGKMQFGLEESLPGQIVEAAIQSIETLAVESSIELISEINTTDKIDCDRDRVVQALSNLISNAIKFSSRGSQVIVRVETTVPGIVRFSVIDKGLGIPAEQLSKLFIVFQQLDSSDSRTQGGTGLGLAIAKAIVDQHEGKISVDSIPGEGSTFWFELPSKKSEILIPRSRDLRYKTLLVEDDHGLCELLTEMLSHYGFSVHEASTLKEAHEYLAGHPTPDVIVLDVKLPDGNGLELLDKLRQTTKTDQTPVVVITGRDEGLGTYGHPLLIDWIKKPFEEQRLLSALKLAIHKRTPGQARVLVVDDDKPTRELIKQQLEQCGVEFFEAADGISAVHLARTSDPDLIILDLSMPSPDGFAVVQILRSEKSRSTPLIVYTATDLNEDDKDRLTLGLTAHLTKSRTSENEFLDTVKNLLSGLVPVQAADKVDSVLPSKRQT